MSEKYNHAHTDPNNIDPYRIFFPLGVAFGIIGVSVWPLYSLGIVETIHSQMHIDLQLQGFLFAFVLGFLLTAIPRFSQTWVASRIELILVTSFFVTGNVATLMQCFLLGRICFFVSLMSVFIFAMKRFVKRKSNPPNPFIFVGVGLVVGLLASVVRILHQLDWFDSVVMDDFIARRMLSEGMTTLLVLGIGAKLIPLFFGTASFFPAGDPMITKRKDHRERLWFVFLALSVVSSFFIEQQGAESFAHLLRASVISIVFLFHMKIWKKIKSKGVQVKSIKLACWVTLLSFWSTVIHPEYRIEVLHVMFIGGFGTLILCIATRVILSHGQYPVESEKTSVTLFFGVALMIVAMVFRSISSLFPVQYFYLLGVSGICWIVGLSIWGIEYSKKAIVINKK